MKISPTLSLALNALLLGLLLRNPMTGPRPGTPAPASSPGTNHVTSVQPQPAPPPASEPLPQVVQVNEPFHWAQVESPDYRVYLANLRAIGCPEPTVQDILIADLNDLFAARVKALVDEVSGRFWESIIRKDDFEEMIDKKHDQLRVLEDERDAVFTALFGDNDPRSAERREDHAAGRREQWEQLADFLPEEKRARLVAASENLEQAWEEFLRTPHLTDAQRQARRKELDAAHDQALRECLTPAEFDELRLRQSPAARVRDRLVGLDLPGDDARALASIELAKNEAQTALSKQDADFKSRTAQLQQQAETQTRELLGEDRYAAFQRAADDRYEPIYRVTQRLELPDATAAQAYAIRRQAEDAARQLRENESLSAAERQAMLQAIGAETQQSLATVLGPKGFAAYDKNDGGWMTQLTSPPP